MSTRGCVAIGTPDAWRGVYNHYDSYPTGLGVAFWQHLQELLKEGKSPEDFARELLAYDDWRAFLNKGICEYCGRHTSQPHSISGVIFGRREEFKTKEDMRRYFQSLPAWKGRNIEIERMIQAEWQTRENIARTGYPDPRVKHHKHETGPSEKRHITSDDPDPLFIEWVYVIDLITATLHVLAHNGHSKPANTRRAGLQSRLDGNGRWDYGHCVYWHEPVGSFPIQGPEPNWEALESAPVAPNPTPQIPENAHGNSDDEETQRKA